MAFQKVAGERTYFKYKDCTPQQPLVTEGVYVGPEQGKFGIQHLFRQRDKKTVCLNSAGHLNWLLENYATPGKTLCNVIYDQRIKLTKGPMAGKDAHRFELEVDDGDGVTASHKEEVPAAKAAAYTAADEGADISL